MSATLPDIDPFDVRRAQEAPGALRAFNDAGVLSAADVQVARRLAGLTGEPDDDVLLAAALAVRAPRLGSVHVDLATIRDTAAVDTDDPVDVAALPWPEPAAWIDRLARSALVTVGDGDAAEPRPLRLVHTQLHLDRYWREEGRVAADLRALAESAPAGVDDAALSAGLRRLFPDAERGDRQRLAAASAVLRRFAVVAGGPGTGKTTTVARIVALLTEQADPESPPLIALAAPTGKAAARLEEAVHTEARTLDVADHVRAHLLGLEASTLHRLLGKRPESHSRFRHDRQNRLPHDVVVVDETSMVGLSLMARLVESVRPDARLVLVGDPGQLTSIEAGAVLGDVVGPAVDALRMRPASRERLSAVVGEPVAAAEAGSPIGDGIVVLERVHRYGGGIAELANAVRRGDAGAAVAVLEAGHGDVLWLPFDPADPGADLTAIRRPVVTQARALREAAEAGDAEAALAALGTFRVLCAHRHGPHGVTGWTTRIESWLADAVPGFTTTDRWYLGRPLLVTENDYGLRLYNGDTGVIVRGPDGRPTAAFERRGQIALLSPTRLDRVDTVFATTIHKAQGSQFVAVAIVLPPPDSLLLSRELLYTAVTRGQERVLLHGGEAAITNAVDRGIARASGLRARLAN